MFFYFYPLQVVINMKKRAVTACKLPMETGENFIELMVQSPSCLYAYWELSMEFKDMATRHFKTAWSHLSLFLRLFDVTGINFDGENANQLEEYLIQCHCSSFYFSPLKAGHAYLLDLGVKSNGEFLSLLRSKVALTPPDRVSPPLEAAEEPHLAFHQGVITGLPSS